MTPIERKARELLAAEYERDCRMFSARMVRDRSQVLGHECDVALRALVTALTPPAGGLPELPEPDGLNEIESVEHPYYYEDTLHAYALEAIAASRVGWMAIESCPNVSEQRILLAWPDGTVEQGMWLKNPTWEGYRPESLRPWPKGKPHLWQPLPAAPQVALNRGGEEC